MHPTEEQARLVERLRELVAQAGPPHTQADEALVETYLATLERLLDTGWTDALEDAALIKAVDEYDFSVLDDPRGCRYYRAIWKPPAEPIPLLRNKIRQHDALLMDVRSLGQQRYRGRIVRCYSQRFAAPGGYPPKSLEFVGSSGSWGNRTLADGERAIVFMRWLGRSGYYQDYWRGHLSLREVDGAVYACLQDDCTRDGQRGCWGPPALRAAASFLAGPGLSGTYLPFELLEAHLLEEIALASRASSS